jgi:hypothetical protein
MAPCKPARKGQNHAGYPDPNACAADPETIGQSPRQCNKFGRWNQQRHGRPCRKAAHVKDLTGPKLDRVRHADHWQEREHPTHQDKMKPRLAKFVVKTPTCSTSARMSATASTNVVNSLPKSSISIPRSIPMPAIPTTMALSNRYYVLRLRKLG